MYLLDNDIFNLIVIGEENTLRKVQQYATQILLFIYSPEAEAIYQTFSPAILRIGAHDCRIAAQAMAHGMTVITRNLRDFQAIGAPCEDWSVA